MTTNKPLAANTLAWLTQIVDADDNIENFTNLMHKVSHNLKGHTTNFALLLNLLGKETRENERKELLAILKEENENVTKTINGLGELFRHKRSLAQ